MAIKLAKRAGQIKKGQHNFSGCLLQKSSSDVSRKGKAPKKSKKGRQRTLLARRTERDGYNRVLETSQAKTLGFKEKQ